MEGGGGGSQRESHRKEYKILTSSVLLSQVRESPHIPKTDSISNNGEKEFKLVSPTTSVLLFPFSNFFIFGGGSFSFLAGNCYCATAWFRIEILIVDCIFIKIVFWLVAFVVNRVFRTTCFLFFPFRYL